MKVASSSQLASAVAFLWLTSLATAHPYHHKLQPCPQSETVAADIVCGRSDDDVADCVARTGADAHHLTRCLVAHAGCTHEEARAEAAWVAKRCQGGETPEVVEEVVIELRQVEVLGQKEGAAAREKRDTTTAESTSATTATSSTETTTATSDTTSSSSTTAATTSTDSTSSTTATSSSSSTSSASSSSSSSTTASSTSSSTASSTSSTASSTSTSTSSSSSTSFAPWSYIIAAAMGVYVALCMGCICWKCCSERNDRKKAAKLADEKEALALIRK